MQTRLEHEFVNLVCYLAPGHHALDRGREKAEDGGRDLDR
jgi:hypothetical protein